MPTEFDWRVSVASGRALFVCQYLMASSTGRSSNLTTGGELSLEAASNPAG
ncbi:MAG: hypothetical protein H6883_13660 [Rhodobiaceae bacterium]|nr:hypothetical protein [Rhodobiaceae bacterium]